ncbi:3'-5' exonuclease [Intrasporangium mesophilum]
MFSVVDVETSGLDLRHDEILSIGVVPIRRARVTAETFYAVCRPDGPISPESMKVHALTSQELAAADSCREVIEKAAVLMRGTVLVAHAAWVERAFIDRVLQPSRQRLPKGIVDTAALARAAALAEADAREPSLEWLARTLGLPVHTPHHALGDAATTAMVLLALIGHLERVEGPLDITRLIELSRVFGR